MYVKGTLIKEAIKYNRKLKDWFVDCKAEKLNSSIGDLYGIV